MQEEQKNRAGELSGLSETWQALLGTSSFDTATQGNVPTLETDPWSTLVHATGVEMVDLQQVHLNMSTQDMEQVLHLMEEQPSSQKPD